MHWRPLTRSCKTLSESFPAYNILKQNFFTHERQLRGYRHLHQCSLSTGGSNFHQSQVLLTGQFHPFLGWSKAHGLYSRYIFSPVFFIKHGLLASQGKQ